MTFEQKEGMQETSFGFIFGSLREAMMIQKNHHCEVRTKRSCVVEDLGFVVSIFPIDQAARDATSLGSRF